MWAFLFINSGSMQSHKLTTIVGMCRDDGRIYASEFWMLVVLHVGLVLLLLVSEYIAWWSGLGMDWITFMIGIIICLSSIHHVLIHTRGRLVGRYIIILSIIIINKLYWMTTRSAASLLFQERAYGINEHGDIRWRVTSIRLVVLRCCRSLNIMR